MKRILFATLMGSILLFAAISPSKAISFKPNQASVVADSTEGEKKAEKKKSKKKKKKSEQ
ncbi:MAG: hypothetical protein D0433_05995 [Candidatus Thermochlorobacter aerophilum]|jgi:hypothetical protein|uniref:Uncharacterized protein n=1 Tax=Candidatus Thermochlorobacter aerophilus TaxID=1868324 RepID=A0A395M168_9BACT|nr:MAG: hypothetical protein D0433_05995 [Candidatus Thermochlorobacter aerophilum]